MIREFLKEAEALEVTLRASVQIENQSGEYTAEPIADGEKKIGVVDDRWLRALFLAYKKRVEAAPRRPEDLYKMSPHQVRRVSDEFETLSALIWGELRAAFDVSNGAVGLRASWIVVSFEEKRRPLGAILGGINSLNDLLDAVMEVDCGDPDCPTHGKKRTAGS